MSLQSCSCRKHGPVILHSQNHGWWRGNVKSECFSNRGFDLVIPEYSEVLIYPWSFITTETCLITYIFKLIIMLGYFPLLSIVPGNSTPPSWHKCCNLKQDNYSSVTHICGPPTRLWNRSFYINLIRNSFYNWNHVQSLWQRCKSMITILFGDMMFYIFLVTTFPSVVCKISVLMN